MVMGGRVLLAHCAHDDLLGRREGLRQRDLCRGRLGLDLMFVGLLGLDSVCWGVGFFYTNRSAVQKFSSFPFL